MSDSISHLLLACLHENKELFPCQKLNLLGEREWKALLSLATGHYVGAYLSYCLNQHTLFDSKQKGWVKKLSEKREGKTSYPDEDKMEGRKDIKQNGKNHLNTNIPSVKNALDVLAGHSAEMAIINLRYFAEFQQFLFQLRRIGIEPILLKGVYLAHNVYPSPGLREMADLDLLFRKEDLEPASRILFNLGYQSSRKIDFEKDPSTSHHLPPLYKPDICRMELHWNIIRPQNPRYTDPEGFWERSEPLQILGFSVRTLSAEDLLLHLCLHLSYQHHFSFGLRPLVDIALTTKKFKNSIDWEKLIYFAQRYRWERGVSLSLYMAKKMIGADVPEGLLHSSEKRKRLPAGFEPVVREQILTQKEKADSVSQSMTVLLSEKGLFQKTATAWQKIFISRRRMASKFGVGERSLWLLYYYPLQLFRVIKNRVASLSRSKMGETGYGEIYGRRKRIAQWLDGDIQEREDE